MCLPAIQNNGQNYGMVNYHIQPSFCQWACSILGHDSCSGSVLLCQVLDKRDTAFWSCGVQEEWFPCDLKEQVVGKHLHGFFQMAFSNKTPEERTKWLFLRSLPFFNLVQYVQNYLHKLRQYWKYCKWPLQITLHTSPLLSAPCYTFCTGSALELHCSLLIRIKQFLKEY